MTYVFQFFRSLRQQRESLLAASDYAPVPFHPSVVRILETLGRLSPKGLGSFTERRLWRESLKAVRELMLQSASWHLLSAFLIVASLYATRHVLKTSEPIWLVLAFCSLYFVADCTKNVIMYFDLQRRAQIARGVQLTLFSWVNQKLLVLDRKNAGNFTTGTVKTLVSSDVEAVEDFITAAVSSWIPALAILVMTAYPIVSLMGWVGAVGVAVTLIQVPIAFYVSRYIERFKESRQAAQDKLTTLTGEWVRNIRLVRYLGWEPAIAQRIRAALRRLSIETNKSHFMICLAFGISYSWWMLPIVVMLSLSLSTHSSIAAEDFFPSIWLLALLSNQIQFLPHSLSQYGEASAAAGRIVSFLRLPEVSEHLKVANADDLAAKALGVPVRIHLSGVSVKHGQSYALKDVSLSFDLKSRVAVVGKVGAGKSTLLELIAGERAPTTGVIDVEFDSGIRADLWFPEARAAYRQFISFSPQEPFLSNASLASNIDLHKGQISPAVVAASKQAMLSPDIESFPKGFEEEIGETGINLSGGQKQRVSLARAFVSGRPFMLLDDPLSAVDTQTEARLFASFCEASRGFILVTHRIDHIHRCDRVLVLEDGLVVEDGVPSLLLADPHSHLRRFEDALERGVR